MRNPRKSPRLKEYDYSTPAWYFITTNVDKQKNYFGSVEDSKMLSNKYGQIVKECWNDLPKHYKNIRLDYFVVMPNHFHGIVILDNVGESLKPSPTSLTEVMRGFKTFSSRRINEIYNSEKKFK